MSIPGKNVAVLLVPYMVTKKDIAVVWFGCRPGIIGVMSCTVRIWKRTTPTIMTIPGKNVAVLIVPYMVAEKDIAVVWFACRPGIIGIMSCAVLVWDRSTLINLMIRHRS